jgi:iron(II)-dependent oxidoreductase
MEFKLPLVEVDEGAFFMGAYEHEAYVNGEEYPPRNVSLSKFWIMKMPVTMRLWRAFLDTPSGQAPGEISKELMNRWNALPDDYPAVWVSWYDAETMGRWLSSVTGISWQLPTEAQWEKACRGNDRRIFPWGNADLEQDDEQLVWAPGPVARRPEHKSAYGCLDMCENVLEWCKDWFDPEWYAKNVASDRDPSGPASGEYKVCRGGNAGFRKPLCCFRRDSYWEPNHRSAEIGFRLVKTGAGE